MVEYQSQGQNGSFNQELFYLKMNHSLQPTAPIQQNSYSRHLKKRVKVGPSFMGTNMSLTGSHISGLTRTS